MSTNLPAARPNKTLSRLKVVLLQRESILLLLVLATYVALALLYHFTVPWASRPDEPWHMAYVEHLQEHGSLPVVDLRNSGYGDRPESDLEGHQPPLYYVLVEWLTRDEHLVDVERIYAPNPHLFSTVWGNRNPWLPQGSHAYATLQSGRFLSLFFGLVALLALYGMVRIFASSTLALLATAFMAFNPMFLFISTSFSNDLMVTAICAVTVWLAAWTIGKPARLGRAVVFGILIGSAALTKLSGFTLIVFVPLVTLLDQFVWHRRKEPARNLIAYLAIMIVIACLIPLPWFVRNWRLYGDPAGTAALQSMVGAREGMISLSELGELLDFFWKGYWLDFSPGGLVYGPRWYYWVYALVLLLPLLGLVLVWRKLKDERPYLILNVLWISIYAAALLFTTVRAASLMGGGRLLFPVSTSLTALFTIGILYPLSQRVRPAAASLVTALALSSAIFAWAAVLWPAYRLPTVSEKNVAELPNRSAIHIGGSFVLDGWEISTDEVRPGEVLEATLYWHRSGPVSTNYNVFLQIWPLESATDHVFEKVNTHPGLGTYPTTRWPADTVLADRYPIPVRPYGTLDEPLAADLVVGLFDLETMERLSVTLEDQSVHDHVKLERIIIRPATAVAVPESARMPHAIQFNTGLQLIGWQLGEIESDGLCLDLWWQGADAQREDLTVFVHAYGVGDNLVAQADGPPRQGQFPTSLWKGQDIVRDRHCFSPPPDQQLARIEVGLYHPVTVERLAAYDIDGKRLSNDAAILEIQR